MKRREIFEIKGLYRDDFRVTAFEFGDGEKSACMIGCMRGNEMQQLYTGSLLVKTLKELEKKDKIKRNHKIMVIPCANPYSINTKKRFWPIDNTDINRMFPGYCLGETTQRIADGIFKEIKDYKYGFQFTSFYMPGNFIPHVRMMKTGFEDEKLASQFGLPYVVLKNPKPFDTTTLNYNWQIWEANAFSVYTSTTDSIDPRSAGQAVRAILNFLGKMGIIEYRYHEGFVSRVVEDTDFISVRTHDSGFFDCQVKTNQEVEKGQLLARVIDPLEGFVRSEIYSPVNGIIFFAHNEPLVYSHTAVFKILSAQW